MSEFQPICCNIDPKTCLDNYDDTPWLEYWSQQKMNGFEQAYKWLTRKFEELYPEIFPMVDFDLAWRMEAWKRAGKPQPAEGFLIQSHETGQIIQLSGRGSLYEGTLVLRQWKYYISTNLLELTEVEIIYEDFYREASVSDNDTSRMGGGGGFMSK